MSIEDQANWIGNSPRGEDLPIDVTYPYSHGKPIYDPNDLPEGYGIAFVDALDDRVQHFPTMGTNAMQGVLHAFLIDPDDEFLAVWDEGRWWTPDESAAWLLMLRVPDTYVMAEGMRQAQMPRWWRRAQKRRKR